MKGENAKMKLSEMDLAKWADHSLFPPLGIDGSLKQFMKRVEAIRIQIFYMYVSENRA